MKVETLSSVAGIIEQNMDHIRSFCSCNKKDTNVWKATSLAIGWFALIGSTWLIYEVLLSPANQSTIVSIIYTILVIFLNINQHICKYVTIVLCVIHWLTCLMWLCGNAKNKPDCMLASLIWWGVELGFFLLAFSIFIFFFGLYETIFYYSAWKLEHICLIVSTVLFVSFYIVAVISFKSIKNSVERYPVDSPLLNVLYSDPPVDKPLLNVLYSDPLEEIQKD